MPIVRMLLATAVVVGLALPAAADAAQGETQSHRTPAPAAASSPKAPTPLRAAVAVGQRYWGTLPCNGQVRVAARSPLAPGVHRASDAWVTFASSLGANNLAAPASSYTNCMIALARRRWPTRASMVEDWNILCATMVHEMGHLLGHSHDLTRGSVMVPIFTDGSSIPSICRESRPRAGRTRRG
jgi:hypothetical protein